MKTILSIFGMLVSLGVAYGCDRWIQFLKVENAQNFDPVSFLLKAGLAMLILSAVQITLTSWIILKDRKNLITSLVFLLAGLTLTFLAVLVQAVTRTMLPLGIMEFVTPASFVSFTAAFIAMLGLAGLLMRGNK